MFQPLSISAINKIIDEHILLFQAQDAVYAHLRLIEPTMKEMEETRERISIMKKLWFKIELSETPKAHLIFVHTADDQVKFGGLGNKIDFSPHAS